MPRLSGSLFDSSVDMTVTINLPQHLEQAYASAAPTKEMFLLPILSGPKFGPRSFAFQS
jgi:hypothetical protein